MTIPCLDVDMFNIQVTGTFHAKNPDEMSIVRFTKKDRKEVCRLVDAGKSDKDAVREVAESNYDGQISDFKLYTYGSTRFSPVSDTVDTESDEKPKRVRVGFEITEFMSNDIDSLYRSQGYNDRAEFMREAIRKEIEKLKKESSYGSPVWVLKGKED